ncbi:UxaA family hydrolase [Sphingomonas sanxanigenens]|uniref:SAF domain-containing protein n=1 Tax=Sphingomonas sanxanigenens DSM 19645 = NX02 TaxID=1123269 RepID=W0AFT6_9SPHN|nr:UxaA family hydrolase [Sphingomonas sanxanigenens]AHE55143.1 hypothetical protein NX02_17325 [Sphingomonas sanxanigenens DSM 19645 = NX02]
MTIAFRIHAADNVATMLDDAAAGDTVALRGDAGEAISALEAIAHGHKIALAAVAAGDAVVKFGIPIGRASTAIAAGSWVHLHNCKSGFDERSGGFDAVTGAAKDMAYD